WLAGPAARAPSIPVEEREMGPGIYAAGHGRARILGAKWLSHAGRSVEGRAVRRARAHASRHQPAAQPQQEEGLNLCDARRAGRAERLGEGLGPAVRGPGRPPRRYHHPRAARATILRPVYAPA